MNQPMIPVFNLQIHHQKVQVPAEFDLKDLARKYFVFPLKVTMVSGKKRLLLAMVNPHDAKAIADIEFRSGLSVTPVQADRVDVQWLIQTHYFGRKLSPVARTDDSDMSFDIFKQLEMTTDEQKRPEWVEGGLAAFHIEKISQ